MKEMFRGTLGIPVSGALHISAGVHESTAQIGILLELALMGVPRFFGRIFYFRYSVGSGPFSRVVLSQIHPCRV
jgi:hypothetical protein